MKIYRTVLAAIILVSLLASKGTAQTENTAHVRPVHGSRMVVGNGEVEEYTLECFLHLCREKSPSIVVIDLEGSPRIAESRFKEHGAGSITTIQSLDAADAESLSLQLLDASGVWIEGKTDAMADNPLLIALLKNVARRNGVVAVGSSSAALLSVLDPNDAAKRLRSPFAKCEFHFGKESSANDDNAQHHVHFMIPDSSVLVVHGGRKIAGYGNQDVSGLVAAANGWPERRETFECPDVFSPGSYPFYALDLLSLVRSANERSKAVFPPKATSAPMVKSGTLFLHGGSRVEEDVMKEFVELAGGNDAPIVCIPSAQRFDWSEAPESYCAEWLSRLGHSNFTVMHTDDPAVAEQSEEFAELLKNAKGVWIDGGRTYRFMDCYEGTQVETLIGKVLERGGVVGGSSAGCQVPSDFLVRGNPRSNRDISHAGYTRGMGLLKGVIIDAHFLQRGRHEPFLELMKEHPQMLGIGIDENTAVIINKHSARVIGPNAVSFYDLKGKGGEDFKPVILKSGETYDLKSKTAVK